MRVFSEKTSLELAIISWVWAEALKSHVTASYYFNINWGKTIHDPRKKWQQISPCLNLNPSGSVVTVVVCISSLVKATNMSVLWHIGVVSYVFINHLEQNISTAKDIELRLFNIAGMKSLINCMFWQIMMISKLMYSNCFQIFLCIITNCD